MLVRYRKSFDNKHGAIEFLTLVKINKTLAIFSGNDLTASFHSRFEPYTKTLFIHENNLAKQCGYKLIEQNINFDGVQFDTYYTKLVKFYKKLDSKKLNGSSLIARENLRNLVLNGFLTKEQMTRLNNLYYQKI